MAHPKSTQALIDADPFKEMLISDASFLNNLDGRSPCPQCGKSRKFFCYTCYVPIKELKGLLPIVKLPIDIDIIKHKSEIDGKSTAAHAAILAPHNVKVYTYPDLPNYEEEKNVVLIFPSADAISINQLFGGTNSELEEPAVESKKGYHRGTLLKEAIPVTQRIECGSFSTLPVTKAVFIDSTWNQSRGIYKDDRIRKLPCVVLQNRISQFWRHQKGSPRWYLSTVEAVHQFLLEIHLNAWGVHPEYKGLKNCFTENTIPQKQSENIKNTTNQYNGQYDNLLFFFSHMYDLIHAYYDHDNLHAYKRRLQ